MFGDEEMPAPVMLLSELEEGQEADFFALLSEKQELTTRDGKPYFRVLFRDSQREVGLPIWADSPLANSCRNEWVVGEFYKLRAKVLQTNFGPQLEIRRIRPVAETDAKDGFDPMMCLPVSRFDPEQMYAELAATAKEQIQDEPLRQLVLDIYDTNRVALLALPAARRNHHACVGGFLEHTLNVTRTCVHLAEKYTDLYPDMQPPLDKDLIVAGAMLHDVGKLRELRTSAAGTEYSAAGELIGHILQGRDIIREMAAGREIDAELLLDTRIGEAQSQRRRRIDRPHLAVITEEQQGMAFRLVGRRRNRAGADDGSLHLVAGQAQAHTRALELVEDSRQRLCFVQAEREIF
jgi:3'-5' exoribonuclease